MAELRLYLLGAPHAELEGNLLKIDRRKEAALLAYLALTPQLQRRDFLAALLWPGYDQSFARANLRRALSRLNSMLGEGWLAVDREQVILDRRNLWVDVDQFNQWLALCNVHGHAATESCPACLQPLTAAMELYQNEFMAGFTLVDSPRFDDWQRFQSESLHHSAAQALERLAHCLIEVGDWPAAIGYARRWLALDPFHEPALRWLMRLYGQVGDRAAALHQYDEWVRLVATDLGLPPSDETTALYQEIKHNLLLPSIMHNKPNPAAKPKVELDSVNPSVLALAEHQAQIRPVTVLCVGLHASLHVATEAEEWAAKVTRLLTMVQEILTSYEARIDRLLSDSVVAIFGATQAHEDDAERAIHAALELHAAATQLHLPLCVGISSGEAYYGPARAGAQEVTTIGPTVTFATHLCDRAGAGGTLVGDSIYQQTRLAFHFSSRVVALPGDAHSVTAHQLLHIRHQSRKTRGFENLYSDLIGRDGEFASLRAALVKLAQGEGQLVLLMGEAGVGKSRLVAEVAAHAETYWPTPGNGALVLEGRCVEMNQMAPYGPFVNLLRSYFASHTGDTLSATAESIRSTLRALVADGLLSTQQEEEIGPLLGHLLTIRFGDQWDDYLVGSDPHQIRHRVFAAIEEFLTAQARRQPLILILEDLHWADDLSLDLVGQLMNVLASYPILLFCVYRPIQKHRSRHLAMQAVQKCPGRNLEIHLHELSRADSHDLVNSLLQAGDITPKILDLIYYKAEGNPFFIEELIRALIDAKAIYRDGAQWRARDSIKDSVLPISAQSIILSRFDRLLPAQQRLAQQASVIGHIFPVVLLARLSTARAGLEDQLWELEAQGLLYQQRSAPQAEYAFRHVLTQEAIYRTLLRKQRAELHQRVAEAIEEQFADTLPAHYEQLAYHYARSEAWEKAIEYLVNAGEKARSAYLNEDAVDNFVQALTRMDALQTNEPLRIVGQWRLTALRGLGQVHFSRGKIQQAEICLRQAIAVGQEISIPRLELFRLYHLLGDMLFWLDRYDELMQMTEHALASLGPDRQSIEAALMNQLAAVAAAGQDDMLRFLEFQYRNAHFLHNLPYIEELRPAYFGLVKALALGKRIAEAQSWLLLFEERVRNRRDLRGLGEVYLVKALNMHQGDLRGALASLQQCLELFAKTGDIKHIEWVQSEMGEKYLCLGEVDNAEEAVNHLRLDMAEKPIEPGSARFPHVKASMVAASILCCSSIWDEALGVIERIKEQLPSATAAILSGRILLAQANHGAAREQFTAALRALLATDTTDPTQGTHEHELRGWGLADAISGLEAACDDANDCKEICRQHFQEHLLASKQPLRQWFLDLARVNEKAWRLDSAFAHLESHPIGANGQVLPAGNSTPTWVWYDPLGDCSLSIKDGIEVRAANGRDFWQANLSAPRVLQTAKGDFAIETICTMSTLERPAIGGLLLWKDQGNFLRLVWGTRGATEVAFEGCVNNREILLGRGRLPGERIYLRLERVGMRVTALCSVDGLVWHTVGSSEFHAHDPVEVGLHAIGYIDRTVYPSAYREGTAIHFLSFQFYRYFGH